MYLNDPSGKEKKENSISFIRRLAMTLEFPEEESVPLRIFVPFLELLIRTKKCTTLVISIHAFFFFFLHVRHL